jgi:hypothetical protein
MFRRYCDRSLRRAGHTTTGAADRP